MFVEEIIVKVLTQGHNFVTISYDATFRKSYDIVSFVCFKVLSTLQALRCVHNKITPQIANGR